MTFVVSPLTIRIMFSAYCSQDVARMVSESEWASQAGRDARDYLHAHKLIGCKDGEFVATERGKAWVRYICNTPLPVCTWKLPERGA